MTDTLQARWWNIEIAIPCEEGPPVMHRRSVVALTPELAFIDVAESLDPEDWTYGEPVPSSAENLGAYRGGGVRPEGAYPEPLRRRVHVDLVPVGLVLLAPYEDDEACSA